MRDGIRMMMSTFVWDEICIQHTHVEMCHSQQIQTATSCDTYDQHKFFFFKLIFFSLVFFPILILYARNDWDIHSITFCVIHLHLGGIEINFFFSIHHHTRTITNCICIIHTIFDVYLYRIPKSVATIQFLNEYLLNQITYTMPQSNNKRGKIYTFSIRQIVKHSEYIYCVLICCNNWRHPQLLLICCPIICMTILFPFSICFDIVHCARTKILTTTQFNFSCDFVVLQLDFISMLNVHYSHLSVCWLWLWMFGSVCLSHSAPLRCYSRLILFLVQVWYRLIYLLMFDK